MIFNYKDIFRQAISNSSYWYINRISPYLYPIVNIVKNQKSKKTTSCACTEMSLSGLSAITLYFSYFQPSLIQIHHL